MLLIQPRPRNHEHENLATLHQAQAEVLSQRAALEARICAMFGATKIHPETPLMAHGWRREIDPEIYQIVGRLIPNEGRISILEVGGGTTWGGTDANFGVPGLARIIKHAFPRQSLVTVSDRARGFDLFFVQPDGALVHTHYRDDRPPQHLSPSLFRHDGILIPASLPFIHLSMQQDKEFASWVTAQERNFGVSIAGGKSPLFIRPELDHEVEARLFGVRAMHGIDYLHLRENLEEREQRSRYDLIIGRHLLPQYLPSRLQLVMETLPVQLQQCAHHAYVHFDRCFFGDKGYADLVFQHHEYL